FMNDHILNDANTMIGDLKQLEGLSRNLLWMTLLQILVGVGCAYFITNGITANVTSICNELDVAANDITDAAGRLTQGAITLAQNVSEQGASVEESSASLEEISSMTAQTSTDAQDTAKNVDGTVNRIMQGTAEMSKMVAAMNEINDSATSIGNIIGTIENIAFQTNLLALNAAVEAARAGEMGKGFAVVAEEVRSLAQRSATAAHETADLITTTIDRIGNGVKISNEVEATFHTIESDTKKINELVSRISSAMKEESVGISQIKTAVNQLESIAEGNSEISEQTATTSGKMEEQSRALLGIVLRLKAIVTGESAAGAVRAPAAPAARPKGLLN
ncbi:MAG: hypothetical protein J6333_02260, partial [Planctomycetes bacterium]|nr:hypothetical protein [Planctomycetota bacterium]